MTVGDRIKLRRQELGFSQTEVADKIEVSKQTLYKYENNIVTNIPSNKIELLASLLNTTPSYLMGWNDEITIPDSENIIPLPTTYTVPLLGEIACGKPILAEENIEGMVKVPEYIQADFALRCKGDSMIGARILDGDIVYIRQQPDANIFHGIS